MIVLLASTNSASDVGGGNEYPVHSLAGAEAPALVCLRGARHTVARREPPAMVGLGPRNIPQAGFVKAGDWAGNRGAGTEKPSAVAPESFICRRQSLFPYASAAKRSAWPKRTCRRKTRSRVIQRGRHSSHQIPPANEIKSYRCGWIGASNTQAEACQQRTASIDTI